MNVGSFEDRQSLFLGYRTASVVCIRDQHAERTLPQARRYGDRTSEARTCDDGISGWTKSWHLHTLQLQPHSNFVEQTLAYRIVALIALALNDAAAPIRRGGIHSSLGKKNGSPNMTHPIVGSSVGSIGCLR